MPIAPDEIITKIQNKNKVVSLINGDDLNLIKNAGLTEFTFDLRLPLFDYPAVSEFRPINEVLEHLEMLKANNRTEMDRKVIEVMKFAEENKWEVGNQEKLDKLKAEVTGEKRIFQFIVIRHGEGLVNSVNEKVTLEDYDIKESAKEAGDIIVTVKLKKYIPLKTQVMDLKEMEGKLKAVSEAIKKPVAPRPGEELYQEEKAKKEAQERAEGGKAISGTKSGPIDISKGKPMVVEATAYPPTPDQNQGGTVTANGNKLVPYKYIAVDPRVIEYGTRVYIPEFKDSPFGGVFIADDCGGAIKGKRIDVLLPNKKACYQFGRKKNYTIYIL